MSDDLKILPVKLKASDLRELQKAAREENKNTSQLVRSLIAEYMRSRSGEFTSDELVHGRKPA